MAFDMRDLRIDPGPRAHLHSIHVEPDRVDNFEQDGFMFGVKLSLNKRVLGVNKKLELFQSVDGCVRGCLEDGAWVENGVFYRHTFTLGRIKWYVSSGIVRERTLVTCKVGT
jgi:hypothetical protein